MITADVDHLSARVLCLCCSVFFPLFLWVWWSVWWQNLSSGERVPYSLYGIVEHSGSMRGGHYTAYVRVRPPQRRAEHQRRNVSGKGHLSHKSGFQLIILVHLKSLI